jgi:NCS1 family nucleobase:cation symporter-1
MASWQAVLTVFLGNIIVLIPMALIGHAGAKHGIPFPVLLRSSFGIYGAKLPATLRGLVACGWFGIQTWVGGSAIYVILNVLTNDFFVGAKLPILGIDVARRSASSCSGRCTCGSSRTARNRSAGSRPMPRPSFF